MNEEKQDKEDYKKYSKPIKDTVIQIMKEKKLSDKVGYIIVRDICQDFEKDNIKLKGLPNFSISIEEEPRYGSIVIPIGGMQMDPLKVNKKMDKFKQDASRMNLSERKSALNNLSLREKVATLIQDDGMTFADGIKFLRDTADDMEEMYGMY